MKRAGLRFSTALILTASFTVVSGVLLIGQNLNSILTLWGQSLQMTVYLSEEVSPTALQQIETNLKNNDRIGQVEFVSNEKALSQFKEQMSTYAPNLLGDQELLKAIPSSFQLSLASKIAPERQLSVMEELAQTMKKWAGVNDVSYGQEWVQSYAQISNALNGAGLVFTLVIIGCALFVISNCIRSSVHQRREEIEVLELVGATSKDIRKPFIREGLALCFGSTLLGLGAAWGIFEVVENALQSQISLLQLSRHLRFLRWETMSLMLALSLLLGWVATFLCLRSLNDGWAASQKKQL